MPFLQVPASWRCGVPMPLRWPAALLAGDTTSLWDGGPRGFSEGHVYAVTFAGEVVELRRAC
jgi:hypothetical protein